MQKHVRALFTHAAESRLLFVNEPDSALLPASRLFLGRTRAGNVWRFRADLPENLCDELNALCADELSLKDSFNKTPRHFESYVRLLEQNAPAETVSNGIAYQFSQNETRSKRSLIRVTQENAGVLRGGFEKLLEELAAWQPFVALVEDGKAVSVCRSVRITREAHEAGVETLPEFRGRGFAQDATAEWARLVHAAGAIPLYSTDLENHSSQAVARKLNLNCYGITFNIA